jgi:hypothetical protein
MTCRKIGALALLHITLLHCHCYQRTVAAEKTAASTTCLSSNNADAPPTNHHRVKTPAPPIPSSSPRPLLMKIG